MQIGFYMSSADEILLSGYVHDLGALFLPSTYPAWPFPQLSNPLPSATQPYMGHLAIWHPNVFTAEELALPENRAFNPHGRFFVSTVWPVIEFSRPRTDLLPQYQGRLYLEASEQSFRFTRPFDTFSAKELTDFRARLDKLTKLYRHLGTWIRHHMAKVDRGLYCSTSLESTIGGQGRSAPV